MQSNLIEKRFLSDEDFQLLQKEWNFREYSVDDEILIAVDGCKSNEDHSTQCKKYFPDIEISLKQERASYKKALKQSKESGNTIASQLNDACQQAVKTLMNAMYGLNGQMGTTIWALADLKNESVQELYNRLEMYETVAKDLSKRKEDQFKQCYHLYISAVETLQQMIKLWNRIELSKNESYKDPCKKNFQIVYLNTLKTLSLLQITLHHV